MKHVPIAISFRLALRIATKKAPCGWYSPLESPVGPWLWDVNVTAFSALSTILVVGISSSVTGLLIELNVSKGSIASFERCRHVCFTPDFGPMTATQRTDALGQTATSRADPTQNPLP
jgi:hypothetical protein